MNAACLLSEKARNTVIELLHQTDKEGVITYEGRACCAFGAAFQIDSIPLVQDRQYFSADVPATSTIIATLRSIAPEEHPLLASYEAPPFEYPVLQDLLARDIYTFIDKFSTHNAQVLWYFKHACDK